MKSFSGGNYDKKSKTWEIPSAYLSELIDKLCIYDDITINLLKSKSKVISKEIKLNKQNYKSSPFEYQEEGIKYGLTHDNWLLQDAPGLGKSLQLIYLAQELKERENIEHCLIICGLNTLKENWRKEIQKHSNLSVTILGEKVSKKGKVSIGSIPERVKALKQPINEFFVITNIETLRSEEIIKALKKGPNKFDIIFVDEIHKLANPNSLQTTNMLKYNNAKYKVGATGTLLMNSPLDAYVPLKWIGVEKSTFTNFKYFYCIYGGAFGNELVGFKNTNVLKDELEKYSLRRTKDILPNLPPKTIINEYVEMDPKQEHFYEEIKNGVKSQVDKVKLNTTNLLAMTSRLRQATSSPSILTSENIPSAKIDRCCDLIDQFVSNNDKVVVFSKFKATLYELEKQLQKYNPLMGSGDIKDNVISDNVDKFQNDNEHMVFLCTTDKMGTGITLNRATYAIFIDVPWTNALYTQCQDRIHRITNTKPVFIYHLITKDTIDERVLEIVEDKGIISDYIIDDNVSPQMVDRLKNIIKDL